MTAKSKKKKLPRPKLTRAQIADIYDELAKLDPNEASATLTRNNGQTLMFLMLCNRTRNLGEDTTRVDVANALTQQRLQALANSLLEQLRADAVIIEQ